MINSVDQSVMMTMLMYIGPVVAFYLVGVVIASMFLTRCPRPAWLALMGCGLLILSSGSGFFSLIVATSGWNLGLDPEMLANVISILGLILHTTGLALIFTAVFVDRRPRMEPAT